jgi:hypothetical protein
MVSDGWVKGGFDCRGVNWVADSGTWDAWR